MFNALLLGPEWHDFSTELILPHHIFEFGIYLQSVSPAIMLNLRTLKVTYRENKGEMF
jgi:hypothetical protein